MGTMQYFPRTMQEPVDPSFHAASPDSVQSRLLRVIATSRRVPLESVTPDSTFEQLGIDSLDRINLLFDIENEFDISIDDEQARSIANIHQMVAGIEEMLRNKASGTA
jgi:acyl carrier protein